MKTDTDANLSLKADQENTYTQSQVDTTISNSIGAAPQVLNTVQELASALGNDANYATTVQNQLNLNANQSTTFTTKNRNY